MVANRQLQGPRDSQSPYQSLESILKRWVSTLCNSEPQITVRITHRASVVVRRVRVRPEEQQRGELRDQPRVGQPAQLVRLVPQQQLRFEPAHRKPVSIPF